ncbi:alpha/beta hydrolase [Deinococcus metallilatus]|uniref:Alpha/beta hydrolase n=1 Tax=Deinococcus metallilatus TaxID=1211322 RepID=A0AAJ5JYJ0_9DEIO|nr:alpha/beta hydrolase [Deinococcus metallilatus]MBB5294966.1 pimeloyl-ACP methyl ester carboxylesterase [Deinococcus metallilatus]QBY09340.1 alpha/beta hydrolase [Deinococcus metallilatus]RXJ09345.1 alpha/beta hydrolase [Deinococcus metallilatus]TLK28867.1 alpha/beta hydrolase [Deinococcus metallilatus]GMA16898.1 hydrolase [Deinococcus metallilatus]
MNNWHSAVCETNGINIHYTRTGGNKPPLILLHGLMTNGLCWTGLARTLATDYDVIMPDARGHGESSAPAYGYRYEDHANDLSGLIKVLGLSPPVLLGHSMGGMTAGLVAQRQPGLLRGLILADPSFLSSAVQREVRDSDVADQHRQILKKTFEYVVADARRRHPKRAEETLELFSRARLQTRMSAFDVLTPPNPDFRPLVRDIQLPTLLVVAEKGVISATVAEELQGLNPRLQVEQVPEAGHALHIDQPERFSAIVRRFLNSLLPAQKWNALDPA